MIKAFLVPVGKPRFLEKFNLHKHLETLNEDMELKMRRKRKKNRSCLAV